MRLKHSPRAAEPSPINTINALATNLMTSDTTTAAKTEYEGPGANAAYRTVTDINTFCVVTKASATYATVPAAAMPKHIYIINLRKVPATLNRVCGKGAGCPREHAHGTHGPPRPCKFVVPVCVIEPLSKRNRYLPETRKVPSTTPPSRPNPCRSKADEASDVVAPKPVTGPNLVNVHAVFADGKCWPKLADVGPNF